MELDRIKAYVDLVRGGGIAELEITEGDKKIRVLAEAGTALCAPKPSEPPPAASLQIATIEVEGEIVPAPMLGIFFRRPGPEEAPFVEPGASVVSGQVLGIIEAMKTLNHVTAPYDGVVAAILAEDGGSVEYGSPLFRLS
ncbi:acetyl-CoA carboxylase biotin carboxyl carrier protein [Nitratireductor indicus]|uniref:acetyl-CoA carboxylase biotin carboxyl carrier protein n=1 Tax=Nitratireductor indicus TaxID=721133 RepID=UPI0028768D7E|nr:biotin/lipoyl-containing protein [Nitratireductor indicus]MDS1138386.1 biotin/lipoyl-containing protein [Nitratireductor indicus]